MVLFQCLLQRQQCFHVLPSRFKRRYHRSMPISDIKEPFTFAKEMSGGIVPFGLAELRKESEAVFDDKWQVFRPKIHTSLRYLAFFSPKECQQFYYRWQQQRKRWWRLFSADPSRFSFAEVQSLAGDTGEESKILAEFPWGQHCLEVIRYHGSTPFDQVDLKTQNIFSVRANGKRCMPHMVECISNLELGVFTYICDSLKEQKSKRTVCMFHRKMAPFKFSFAAAPTPSPKNEELRQLSRYLSLGLRKIGLATLAPGNDFAKKQLSHQFKRYDALGVPYTLVLKPETLDTGIAGLRGRDTTLEEEVHIGKFFEYGEMLMKNY